MSVERSRQKGREAMKRDAEEKSESGRREKKRRVADDKIRIRERGAQKRVKRTSGEQKVAEAKAEDTESEEVPEAKVESPGPEEAAEAKAEDTELEEVPEAKVESPGPDEAAEAKAEDTESEEVPEAKTRGQQETKAPKVAIVSENKFVKAKEETASENQKNLKKKGMTWWQKLLIFLNILIFLACGIKIGMYYWESHQSQAAISKLADEIQFPEPSKQPKTDEIIKETTRGGDISAEETVSPYQSLKERNSDLVGWISVDGTVINYPVMQNPEDAEFYLYRNFDKEYDSSGLPFLDSHCDAERPSTNLIIYAHSMKSGTMFGSLAKYKKQEYLNEHPVIRFDTMEERGRYEVIAVIMSKVYSVDDDVFKYYQFYQADTEEEFNDYIQNIKRMSLYDTGKSAVFGDELITLSTCEYSNENGRLAVIARKIPQ